MVDAVEAQTTVTVNIRRFHDAVGHRGITQAACYTRRKVGTAANHAAGETAIRHGRILGETDDARCSRTLVFKRTRVRAVRNLHDVRLAFAYGTADDTAAVAHLKRIHIDVAVVGIVADIDRDDAIGHLSYRLDNGADDATCCRKQAVVFVIGARGVHITVVFTAFHRYGHLGIAQNASRECGKDVEVVRFGADSHLAVVHAARVGVEVAGYIAAGDTAEADPARRVFEQDAVIDHQGSRVFRVGDSALGRTRDAADGERGEVRYQIGCDGARIGERRQR